MGDGSCPFGAPVAHEDHAVRHATRPCAYGVREAVCGGRAPRWSERPDQSRVNSGESSYVRLAATCEWITPPSAKPPIWPRAWSSSPSGTILVTSSTLALVEGLVAVTPLGPVPVKGVAAVRGVRGHGCGRGAHPHPCRRPPRPDALRGSQCGARAARRIQNWPARAADRSRRSSASRRRQVTPRLRVHPLPPPARLAGSRGCLRLHGKATSYLRDRPAEELLQDRGPGRSARDRGR